MLKFLSFEKKVSDKEASSNEITCVIINMITEENNHCKRSEYYRVFVE